MQPKCRLDPLDLTGPLAALGKVVGVLQAEPGVGGAAEGLLEADGQVGSNRRLAGADSRQGRLLDLQMRRRFCHCQAERLDAVVSNGLTGMLWVVAQHIQAADSNGFTRMWPDFNRVWARS